MDVRLHPQEADRLTSLRSYEVLDTAPGDTFDSVTRLAARLCRVPVSLITLVDADRQWFLSRHGVPGTQTLREESVCSDAVASGVPLVVADLAAVPRYAELPAVTAPAGVRAYAGVPIIGRDGLPLGTLCVLDTAPREFTADELAGLTNLAQQVVTLLELRRYDLTHGLTAPALVPETGDPRLLRQALEDHEFVPHFQPLVDLRDGRILGLEALARWQHPGRGLLTPEAFLPAMQTGAFDGWLGREMVEASCELLVDLRTRGIGFPDGIAVNASSRQLTRPGLARRVLGALAGRGLPGSSMTCEVTEHTAVDDLEVARRELGEFRAAGAGVVVDDFGVGWSNLSRLLELPVSGLKIDRELVGGMVGDHVRDEMVASAVRLATTMGIDVLAEGVESEAVRHRLLDLGCRRGQGWLFSRAVPASEVPALLTAGPLGVAGRRGVGRAA